MSEQKHPVRKAIEDTLVEYADGAKARCAICNERGSGMHRRNASAIVHRKWCQARKANALLESNALFEKKTCSQCHGTGIIHERESCCYCEYDGFDFVPI